jgi:predicted GTPase
MEQFKQFNVEKLAALATLDQMAGIISEFSELGIDTSEDLAKLRNATEAVQSDVLRIALLGAFSDGKTSVIAAWLGKVMEDMKIDMDESSDQLSTYHPEGLPDECEIIDTPGLFGDKEKTVDGLHVMYEDVTKRYISQAHLLFYVVDATNPLKDSHSPIARWVLRDLNKLSSTIFVINKMDEVTDLTESALFEQQATIKKKNLTEKLQRAANLSEDEIARLNIVSIASNPNGRGLDYWFSKPAHYEARSRIGDLKTITGSILKSNVANALIAKTGVDVVRDLMQQKLAQAGIELEKLGAFEKQNREEAQRIRQDIDTGRGEVKRLGSELFNELTAMEARLLGQLRPLALEDIRAYLEDEIGYSDEDTGTKLHLKIKGAVDRIFDQSSAVTNRISLDIQRQLDSSESFLDAMTDGTMKSVGGALKGVSKLDPATIKATIFAARDVLKQVTGIAIKFKPWEASKLAGTMSKWAGPVGALISLGTDVYSTYKAHEQEQKLTEIKNKIAGAIKSAFQEIHALLTDDEKMLEFFAPQLKQFEKVMKTLADSAETIRANRNKVAHIEERLNSLALASPAPLP